MKRSMFARSLAELGLDRVAAVYLDDTGHMSGVDPLLGARPRGARGRLADGDLVLLLAAGTGYTWAAKVVRWGPRVTNERERGCVSHSCAVGRRGARPDGVRAGGDRGTRRFPAGFATSDGRVARHAGARLRRGGTGTRTPVIFLHGNNDTPFPTACNPFYGQRPGARAVPRRQRLRAERAVGLGYQGDQCDLRGRPDVALGSAHTTPRTSPTCARSCTRCSPTPARSRSTSSAHSLGVHARARVDAAGSRVPPRAALRRDRRRRTTGSSTARRRPANYWQAPASAASRRTARSARSSARRTRRSSRR